MTELYYTLYPEVNLSLHIITRTLATCSHSCKQTDPYDATIFM